MKYLGIYPELTKTYILDRITQEQIMEHFLGISVNAETLSGNSISSPFRVDKNPSCNYYYSMHGKLRLKDWTTRENYDVFDVVAKFLNITVSTKLGFVRVLHEIAKSFRIHKYEDYNEVIKYEKSFNKHTKHKKQKRLVQYKVTLREPNYHDKAYWDKGKVTNFKGIFFIQYIKVSYNGQPYRWLYTYSPKDVCYGYYGGKCKERYINKWKFYFPLRIKGDKKGTRFTSNASFMQGLQYVKPARIGILTKSFKDVKVFNAVGLESVAVAAETTPPSKEEILYLKSLFDYLIVVLDYDKTGISMTQYLKREYRLPYFFFIGEDKDAYDFVENQGQQALKDNIASIYNTYKEEILNYEPKLINYNIR